ncbi:hypothetical protein DID88_007774 [Monilinia fructigena]|uniref:CDC45-like protein n=1 Tax=Monilinia fructigena TaxID=38457 RepID=A0A395J4E9_9HELO|nr:hypothetical protein DID88_007774 [Monilinia fructigena]
MYLPRSQLATLYLHLQKTHHPLSPPVLILVALEPDALCGCRILTQLLKRDYIPHKIQPIAGYGDLEKAGKNVIQPMMENQGGTGELWFAWRAGEIVSEPPKGVVGGMISRNYKPGKGGIIVFDDGDIEEDLKAERDAYLALVDMPEIEENEDDSEGSETEGDSDADAPSPIKRPDKKRKSWSDRDEEDDTDVEDDRPRQRRRSNSSSPIPESPTRAPQRGLLSLNDPALFSSDSRSVSPSPAQPPKPASARALRRRLLKLRRKNELVLQAYYNLGASYSEPISSMMYSLASELGREDNDLLWMTIVGVSSQELYGRSAIGVAVATEKSSPSGWLGSRGSRTRQLLRDEVRRLNPPELSDSAFNSSRNMSPEHSGIIPTTARSPTDTSIRLSPEPKFLLIRHWSLYDSMLHSPYLSARLHIWSDSGRKRLHKLLAKMGYSELYGLDDLVPSADTDGKDRGGSKEGWGFVRSWGWKATLSAQDVGVVVGAILEVGKKAVTSLENGAWDRSRETKETSDEDGTLEGEEWIGRFWDAYDALEKIEELKLALPIAQHLHRAILRTGTSLIEKRQIKHLRAFPALTKLALWIGEAIAEQERESKGKIGNGGRGTGGGGGGVGGWGFGDKKAAREKAKKRQEKLEAKELRRKNKEKIREEKRAARRASRREDEDEDDDEDDETEEESSESEDDEEEDEEDEQERGKGFGRNKFGNAFQEVVEETNARVRIDSFEHCVVEVKKEDLGGFLESLSLRAVVG